MQQVLLVNAKFTKVPHLHTHQDCRTEHREERRSDRTQTTHSPAPDPANNAPRADIDQPAAPRTAPSLTHPGAGRPGATQSRRTPAKSPVTIQRHKGQLQHQTQPSNTFNFLCGAFPQAKGTACVNTASRDPVQRAPHGARATFGRERDGEYKLVCASRTAENPRCNLQRRSFHGLAAIASRSIVVTR